MSEINVVIPPVGVFAQGQREQIGWAIAGAAIDALRQHLKDDDLAFSMFVSRLSQELRRAIGPAGTAQVFRQFADQQQEMADLEAKHGKR